MLRLVAPVGGGKEHLVGTYGGSLDGWRKGPTQGLADLLEAQLKKK